MYHNRQSTELKKFEHTQIYHHHLVPFLKCSGTTHIEGTRPIINSCDASTKRQNQRSTTEYCKHIKVTAAGSDYRCKLNGLGLAAGCYFLVERTGTTCLLKAYQYNILAAPTTKYHKSIFHLTTTDRKQAFKRADLRENDMHSTST